MNKINEAVQTQHDRLAAARPHVAALMEVCMAVKSLLPPEWRHSVYYPIQPGALTRSVVLEYLRANVDREIAGALDTLLRDEVQLLTQRIHAHGTAPGDYSGSWHSAYNARHALESIQPLVKEYAFPYPRIGWAVLETDIKETD